MYRNAGFSLLLWGLVAVAQMSSVREIKAHKSLMRSHDSLVDLEVGRGATQALHIDTPFLRVQRKGLESSSLAEQLDSINVLVATVVSCTWQALRVFVRHGRSQGVEDSAGGDILGCNEDNRFTLALDLLLLVHQLVWCNSEDRVSLP